MGMTLGELARIGDGTLVGNASLVIKGAAALQEAGPTDISFLAKEQMKDHLEKTKAGAVVVPKTISSGPCALIQCDNPPLAFAMIVNSLMPDSVPVPGIHPTAVIEKGAVLGKNITVSAFCYVGSRTILHNGVVLYPNVYIGEDCEVGEKTVVYPQTVVLNRIKIGQRVILHPGVILGCDGFGFTSDGKVPYKVPQVGTVVIEDEVEIGAHSTVDRAALGVTLIKKGSKLDDQVHIGHNTQLGQSCLIAGQTGVSGSVTVGDGVIMGGQVGIADHVKIGSGAMIGAQSGVMKDVEPGAAVSGYPARPHHDTMKNWVLQEKLPEMRKEIKALQNKIKELEERLGKKGNP